MRRESVSSLRVRNLASGWGLRGVVVKGGKTRDIPLPDVVVQVLNINEIELVAPTGFEPVFESRDLLGVVGISPGRRAR